MACAIPTAPTGGTLVTTDSPTYADTTRAVFSCNSGYVMSGSPFATCSTGTWSTFPTCVQTTSNDITINDDSSDGDKVLIYVAIGVCCILGLLLLTCMIVCCCQLCGCFGEGGIFDEPRRGWWNRGGGGAGCCCDCRKSRPKSSCTAFPRRYEFDERGRRYHLDGDGYRCYYSHKVQKYNSQSVVPEPAEKSEGLYCTTFPRRYELDDLGRRYHLDDNGHRCYYTHKIQKNGSHTVVHDHTETPRTFSSTVNEVIVEKKAKELAAWKPHANPVRPINTSTK